MKLSGKYDIDTIASKTVLMPKGQAVLTGGDLFSLNETGEWFIKNLEEEISKDELLKRAIEYFEAENDEEKALIEKDMEDFLKTLADREIIVW